MNWDVLGKVLTEIRSDAGVAAITTRIRPFEPGPGDADIDEGTGKPSHAFVVLVHLGGQRLRSVPVQRPRLAARCYGRTLIEASQLGTAVSNALHTMNGRVHANGLGIYLSTVPEGGEQERDPDTRQPLVTLFIDLIATTQAVA